MSKKKSKNRLVETLKAGGVAVAPTDTLYGLLGLALLPETVERIFEIKKRSIKKPFIILISSREELGLFGITSGEKTEKILKKIWPGSVSVIFPCPEKKFRYLHRGRESLAFRMPKNPDVREILRQTGPLVAPSANPEGLKPARNISEARKYFGNKADFYSAGKNLSGKPSTLVSFEKGNLKILREGSVDVKSLLKGDLFPKTTGVDFEKKTTQSGSEKIRQDLKKLKDPKRAEVSQRFFKTGKGEYGEGDVFWGIKVPDQRKVAKKHAFDSKITFSDLRELLKSAVHEQRFTAVLILVFRYEKGSSAEKEKIFTFYLENIRKINNWDLVDLSAPKILGEHLLKKDRQILSRMAFSENLWERRAAIIATYAFIRNGDFSETFKIAEILLFDKHDLIQKAVGWMLREIGKRDMKKEEGFLKKYAGSMPRTALRYALEKFPEKERNFYLGRV